ncbi:hypothetical protein BGX33_005838 [Mortierella sp. NVP41]|nr:hypothetical protein BGX33_005838 [Mortierella sp. NVP41]
MPPPKWKTEVVPSHKFEFLNIVDFHSNSTWARLRYTWVWIMFFKAIMVLCGDIWTCTILIISGAWTSEIKPTIEISIARWIFTGCILLSFLLLAADFRKANKVIKSEDISYAVSNPIVSGFYCLQKYDYFCFIERIRNSSKLHDKLSFFVFFQLKGWKHLVVQAPRAVINIMTLIAFMKAIGFDLDHLDDVAQILPSLKPADKFTFCVMVFTSLMFIFSGLATLVAIGLWIPLVAKVQGNLKEYVCHKMDKRIDNIIKETTKERARRNRRQQELEDKQYHESVSRGGGNGNGNGNNGGGGGGRGRGTGGSRSTKAPSLGGSTPRRPKPTLPDIDVILANAHEDIRLPSKAWISQQHHRPQHIAQHPYQTHLNHRQQHRHSTLPYNPHHGLYTYHESPPFAHAALANTSPHQPARRSFSSSGHTTGIGYHGNDTHHIQSYQYHPSPPQRHYNLPDRKQSLVSSHSMRTDGGSSPVMYQRSLGGPPPPLLSKAAQIARYYREQQQFQQQYPQTFQRQQTLYAQIQGAATGGSSPHQQQQQQNQHLHPLQSQHYHDTRPHTPILVRAISDGPENWPAHYGFAMDVSQTTETPSMTEQLSIYRPDSGVLPDQNDPYYRQFSAQKSEHGGGSHLHQHGESGEGGSGGSLNERCGGQAGSEGADADGARDHSGGEGGLDRRGSSGSTKATLVYRPDKTELEQYDNLYKGITETHLRVKATRTMSHRSRSSKTPFHSSSSPESPYARALRQQQQQQQQQQHQGLDRRAATFGQMESTVQQGRRNDALLTSESGSQDLPQVAYIQPPPAVASQHHTTPSTSSLASSSTRDNINNNGTRLVHHSSIPNLHHHHLQQHHQLHHRFHSSSSLRSAYTTPSPSSASLPLTTRASSDHLRDKYAHPLPPPPREYGKQELYYQYGFPVVVPPSPLPLNQRSHSEESLGSEPEAIRLKDVLNDLTSSLQQQQQQQPLSPPPSSMLPPSPMLGSGAFRCPSRTGTPPTRSRTPVNAAAISPPPPLAPAPMSAMGAFSPTVDDNVKVEVFEDRNIKVEVIDEDDDAHVKVEIKDQPVHVFAPLVLLTQSNDVQDQGATTAAVAEEEEEPMAHLEADDDDDGYGYTKDEWEERQEQATPPVVPAVSSRCSTDRPPSLPSCPPPNFHPQEAETLLLQSPQQQKRWSSLLKQHEQRRSCDERRSCDIRDNCDSNNNNNSLYQDLTRAVSNDTDLDANDDDESSESLMFLQTGYKNGSKTSLASSSTFGIISSSSRRSNGTHRSPSPPPPPVPSLSLTNLASTLRKGIVESTDSLIPRASIDQVRTSVERATAATVGVGSPSKMRVSTERDGEIEREQRFPNPRGP